MVPDRIEREIRIDAPIDIVWSVVTEPEQITQWFSDGADLELQPGADGTLTFRGSRKGSRPHEHEAVINVRVVRVEPPRYFSFRWNYPSGAEPGESNAPLVEFTLSEHGEATMLKLVESGLQSLSGSEPEKQRYSDDHNRGWDHRLSLLRAHAGGRVGRVAR